MRRAITVEIYAALLAAYRDHPGNHRFAAQQAGIFWRTARRGWEEGWPASPWSAKPIKVLVAEEQALAAVRLKEMDAVKQESLKRSIEEASVRAAELSLQPQAEREKVRDAAIEAREQEGMVIRLARTNSIELLRNIGDLTKGCALLTKKFKEQLEIMLATDATLTPGTIIRWVKELAGAAKSVTESAETALKMERLVLGEPTEIMGLMHVDMSTEDAISEILATQEALARGHAYGTLRLPGQVIDIQDPDAEDTWPVEPGLQGMYADASPIDDTVQF